MNTETTTYKKIKHFKDRITIIDTINITHHYNTADYIIITPDPHSNKYILTTKNPYAGNINPYTGDINKDLITETKPIGTLLWKAILNDIKALCFNTTPDYSNLVLPIIAYNFTHNIITQLKDPILDTTFTLHPASGPINQHHWDYYNETIKEYKTKLKEHNYFELYENQKVFITEDQLQQKLQYIGLYSDAYDYSIDFPLTSDTTKLLRTRPKNATEEPKLYTHKNIMQEPRFYSKQINLAYATLRYYAYTLELPYSNPHYIKCPACNLPTHRMEITDIPSTNPILEDTKGMYIMNNCDSFNCEHCLTELYISKDDTVRIMDIDYLLTF